MILVVQPKFCAKKSVNLFEKKRKDVYCAFALKGYYSFCRCPRDKTLEFEYKMSGEQRFSLVAFRFKSGYQDVYIHCKMTVCRSKEEESTCAKGCQENENDSRKKREVKDDFLIKQFIGPIKVKGEEDKGMYYSQYTMKDLCQAPLHSSHNAKVICIEIAASNTS